MSRTAVGGSGSFGRLSGGCKSGWPPITLGVLQRPPSREHQGWLLFVARENFEGPTNFQRTSKHKKPKGRPELSEGLSNQAGVCDVTQCVLNHLSERSQKTGEKVLGFTMDGRRVSSLSVGSNESEGSGGTRVGEIFQQISNICLPSFFL